MGSDDVRARAEFEAWQMAWAPKGDECERASIEWDELDTPLARLTNGHVVSLEDEWEAWQASRAALAVAPATAQPGAPTWWARSHDDLPRPTLYATEDAARDAASLDGGKVFPLYAAPPATGDAAAVREKCARVCESFKEQLWSGEAVPGTHAGSIATLLAAAIRALPLPAPATAVEEAQRDVVDKAKAWLARPVAGRGAYKGTAALEESIEALLAAESEAAATHAAKGGNCG